jgi:hypothetical protein
MRVLCISKVLDLNQNAYRITAESLALRRASTTANATNHRASVSGQGALARRGSRYVLMLYIHTVLNTCR